MVRRFALRSAFPLSLREQTREALHGQAGCFGIYEVNSNSLERGGRAFMISHQAILRLRR
jgi:hypothetical protein